MTFDFCRERLNRILALLDRHPQGLSLREFARTFSVYSWEIEQAAELGFVTITKRKPRTGRPAMIVLRRNEIISQPGAAKLPPWRCDIKKERDFRHFRFAIETMQVVGKSNGFGLISATQAYRRIYRSASPASARVSACRLKRHLDVKAIR